MKLSSARALKEQLLSTPVEVTAAVASARSFSTFRNARETAERTMSDIALGVAPSGKQDYRLAVRLQRSGPLVTAMTEEIIREAKGEVDVQYVGRLVKLNTQPAYFRDRRRPLKIGSSIGDLHDNFSMAGTLGCFVVGRASPHYLGFLTNNHVIADENRTSRGSPIVQPGSLDRGAQPDDVIGELWKFVRLRANQANLFDAAVGSLYDGINFDASSIGNLGRLSGIGDAAQLLTKATVHKAGRTTGQTTGRFNAFDIDNLWVQYDTGVLRFDNQIEFEGTGNHAFSDSGDSGSLIVDEDLRAIGLLFAGGDEGGTNGKGLTYANPVQPVLDELQVDLEL